MATLITPFPAQALPRDAAPLAAGAGIGAVSLPGAACRDAQVREQWSRLAARAGEPNPFFEWWYMLPSLEALDPAGEVRLVVVERDGEWLGLLPVAAAQRYYGHPVPHLRAWLHDNAFMGGPLIARGHETEVWTALLAHLDGTAGRGLFLHLAGLDLAGPGYRALV
ncbi:MAG: cellulose biosynthesis protein CelD, partial [Sphingomonadales bacterium]|nr:cellulose biosynthesis protein CelD [Sphingomonadales bacterium]